MAENPLISGKDSPRNKEISKQNFLKTDQFLVSASFGLGFGITCHFHISYFFDFSWNLKPFLIQKIAEIPYLVIFWHKKPPLSYILQVYGKNALIFWSGLSNVTNSYQVGRPKNSDVKFGTFSFWIDFTINSKNLPSNKWIYYSYALKTILWVIQACYVTWHICFHLTTDIEILLILPTFNQKILLDFLPITRNDEYQRSQ